MTPVPQPPAGAEPERRPAILSGRRRLLRAYWVTFVVVGSYSWLRLLARFRDREAVLRGLSARHARNARRIVRAIHDLGGLYIKVGQLLSILTNILPGAFRRELEGLQDRVPPRPYREIERSLHAAFGAGFPDAVFESFAREPIASASIAQVHRATLRGGEAVAVKVQYPDIEEIVRLDLRALERIFRVAHRLLPDYGLDQVYREIRAIVLEEIDFKVEAANIEHIAGHFAGREDVGFPRVYGELSTSRVLVTGWVQGAKVSDRDALDRDGIDRAALARKIVEAYCKMIFTDGVYHADPHPGNILARPGPRIVFLDFGAVARVSPVMRQGMVELIQGALARDTARIGRALHMMGFVARRADPRVLERIVEYFHERFQEEIHLDSLNLRDIRINPEKSLQHLADLRRMDISLRDLTEQFHVPREWIMLERTLLLLMGLCTELDPAMNPMDVIRPYLEEFVLGKDRDPTRIVLQTTKDVALSALALPSELKKFLVRAGRGELEVRFLGLDEGVRTLHAVAHQAIFALLSVSGAAFGLVLQGRGQDAPALASFAAAGFFGLMLAGSMLATRAGMRRRRR